MALEMKHRDARTRRVLSPSVGNPSPIDRSGGGLRGLRSDRTVELVPRADDPRHLVRSIPSPAPLDRPPNPFDTPLERTAPAVREE